MNSGRSVTASKRTSRPEIAAKHPAAGDIWLWVAIDADTKLVPCWTLGGRDAYAANSFISDLAARLNNRVQLTTDGFRPYLEAVEGAFGADVDYSMLVKLYGADPKEDEKRYSRKVHRYKSCSDHWRSRS
jgi:transposase-like protein